MAQEASVTDQRQHEKDEHNTQLQRMVAEMQVGAMVFCEPKWCSDGGRDAGGCICILRALDCVQSID